MLFTNTCSFYFTHAWQTKILLNSKLFLIPSLFMFLEHYLNVCKVYAAKLWSSISMKLRFFFKTIKILNFKVNFIVVRRLYLPASHVSRLGSALQNDISSRRVMLQYRRPKTGCFAFILSHCVRRAKYRKLSIMHI